MKRILVALLAVAVPCAAATRSAPELSANDAAPRFDPPKSIYLALGDSITYGFQFAESVAGLPPSGFDTGYVDVLAARLRGCALRRHAPDLQPTG